VEIGDVEKPPFDVDEFKRSLMGDMMSIIRRELGEKRQCNEDEEVSLHADKYRAIENPRVTFPLRIIQKELNLLRMKIILIYFRTNHPRKLLLTTH